MKKTIGILGGMGPEATAYMYSLIIKHTRAERDQDHIKVFIYTNPEIPPRTDAILGEGPNPVPYIAEGFQTLKDIGADFVIVPCVTAHYFLPEVLTQVPIPFLSLLEAAVDWTRSRLPDVRRVGLVASTGTQVSRLFHDAYSDAGIDVLSPETGEQNRVMEAIFGARGIKAGYTTGSPKEAVTGVAEKLVSLGAQAVVAGCTEIPLVLKDGHISVPLIEPMEILAKKAILEAGYKVR